MRLLILLSIFILSSCGKTLPVTDVRSLSGKIYNGPNSRVNLIHDFDKGTMFMIEYSINVPGGMFYSLMNFGLSPYGSELYFFNNNIGKAELVADLIPGREGSYPTNFSDPGGDWIYFLANTEELGREIFRVHKTTFVVEQLPEGISDKTCGGIYDNSFVSTGQEEKGFIVIQENPIIAYGTGVFETGAACAGSFEKRLVEYKYDGSTVTYGEKQVTGIAQAIKPTINSGSSVTISGGTIGDYIIAPSELTKILAYQAGSENEMVVMKDNSNQFVAIFPNGNTYRYDQQIGTVDKILELENNGGNGTSAAFIATDNISDGVDVGRNLTNYKLWVFSLDSNINISPVDVLYGTTNGYNLNGSNAYNLNLGTNIKEILVHDDKLYYIGDLTSLDCSTACINNYQIGQEVGVYDPWGYNYTSRLGVTTIDINQIFDGGGPNTLGSGSEHLISAGDKVCVSADNGTIGSEIICISDTTYALTAYDTKPGALGRGASSKVYLNGNIVFNGYIDVDTFALFHLNLDSHNVSQVGPTRTLFEDTSGNKYPNRILNHNSGKYAFEIGYHDYLGGAMIKDDGTYLDPGFITENPSKFDKSTNESGLPLLRFSDGDLLFGSHFLNRESSWVFDQSTKTKQYYDIGAIISENYIKDNGRYYVSVDYRGSAALAWINPTTKTSGIIKRSCEDEANTDVFCHMLHSDNSDMTGGSADNFEYEYVGVSRSLRLIGEHRGYIFYMAKGNFTGSGKTLFKFKIADESVTLVTPGTFNNVNLIYKDAIAAIFSANSDTGERIFVIKDPANAAYTLNDGEGNEYKNLKDFYVENDRLLMIIEDTGGSNIGFDLLTVDMTDTNADLNTKISRQYINIAAASDIHMLKNNNSMSVTVAGTGIYKYNNSSNISTLIAGSGQTFIKKRGLFTHSRSGGQYYIHNVEGQQVDHFDMTILSVASCATSLNNIFLTKTVLIEQCDDTSNVVGAFLRSTGQRIDLTAFGVDWNEVETRYKVLYESDEKTVISFRKIFNSDPDDIKENKVFEFNVNGAISIIYDGSFKLSTFDLGDGSHISCLSENSDDYNQLILHDFKNNRVELLSGDYSCIPDQPSKPTNGKLREVFSEVYHLKDGKLKGTMRYEDDKLTVGYELYEINI